MDYVFRFLGTVSSEGRAPRSQDEQETSTDDGLLACRSDRAQPSCRGIAVPRRALQHRQPGGCTGVHRLRLDHDSQRRLLQVPELRSHQRLQLSGTNQG